jgi:hypothetical protein
VGVTWATGHGFVAAAAETRIGEQGGTFTTSGTTSTRRTGHTATLLRNGRVLIVGGASVLFDGATLQTVVEATTELYDPVARSFQSAANLSAPRWGHTATLLADGRVLIAGGLNGSSEVAATAEIYDPTTNSFLVSGSTTTRRFAQAATLLADGRVLLTGSSGAELYDPRTAAFVPTANQVEGHAQTATLLTDGTVVVTVVSYTQGEPNHAEVFNPAAGTFARRGDMITLYQGSTATLLSNGKVLFAGGGYEDQNSTEHAELYDPETGTFTPAGKMMFGREAHTATLLTDGTVLIVGGAGNGACAVLRPDVGGIDSCRSSEVYDPGADAFRVSGDLGSGRVAHQATLLDDGTVLVSGGTEYVAFTAGTRPHEHGVLSSTELYTQGNENLLQQPGFEGYLSPALGVPGWVSDHALRQTAAFSETHQPRTGARNGACWTPAFRDCGLYQDVVAPSSGTYSLTMFASADRAGGWVGANVNGVGVGAASVEARSFGDYVPYAMTFAATAGDVIRVWMYSPATPGYVVVDDAYLHQLETAFPGGPGASPDATGVPFAAAQIVDHDGAIWTIGSNLAILRNGVQAAGGWGSQIFWTSSTVYVFGTDNNWYQWTGFSWTFVGANLGGAFNAG